VLAIVNWLCGAYFPNDGVNQTQTDALMFELLKNTTDLQALGYEVAIISIADR
jgi:hypothetical protein